MSAPAKPATGRAAAAAWFKGIAPQLNTMPLGRVVSTTRHRRRRVWIRGLLTLGLAVALGAAALGVVVAQTHAPRSGTTPLPTPSAPSAPLVQPGAAGAASPGLGVRVLGSYQLRCWQDGQLVLEEALQQAPEGAAQTLRLQGSAGAGTAVMLLSVGTATCLIRPAVGR
jgi:hypothetical protein